MLKTTMLKLKSNRKIIVDNVADRVKVPFYGNRVITIAWSRFNSHPRRTRYCVLG